jgi:hypothetical protein
MATLRKLVSDVRAMHKLLSTDNLITDRVVASEIKNNALMLIKRETNLRKLWATDTVFTTIPYLELERVSISEFCDYRDPCTISRTTTKLPRIAEGNYQYLIQGVWSINALGGQGKKFKETTLNRFVNTLRLPIIKNENYYWISDDYLYINDPLLTKIRISALFEEDIPNEVRFSGLCEEDITDAEWCMNPLDRESFVPGYLEKQVLDLTQQRLLTSYFKVKEDLTQNNIDGQAANAPAGS